MHRYDMAQLGATLGLLENRFFLTREKGEQAYQLLREHLQEIPEGQALLLVFPPNQRMDASFADQTILQLTEGLIAGAFGERGLLLEGLAEDAVFSLNAAISLRDLKLAVLQMEPVGTWQYIGHLEPTLEETLKLVASEGRLTAPRLAELLGLAINTASNRLKRLYDQHLVRREFEVSEKGLQYIYSFWQ
jgi:DNA-binding transcriptional ArsR family regulator